MKIRTHWLLLLILGLPLLSFSQQPQDVSIVKLIAAPEQYEGRLVRVSGFLNIEFENVELYLHKEDCVQGLTKNGVWLDLDRESRTKYSTVNLHYALVEGVVDSKHFGHLGATSATLTKVQRVERLHQGD
jgi:hypothetical protein